VVTAVAMDSRVQKLPRVGGDSQRVDQNLPARRRRLYEVGAEL